MSKIAAVVILYNPELSILENIKSYIDQVEKLYVVDNSEASNESLIQEIKSFSKIEYIPNKYNIGIAAALNIGARKAIEEGFDYLLTMDQDSETPPRMVANLLNCFSEDSKIALVSPLIKHQTGRNITFEYILIENINDSKQDALDGIIARRTKTEGKLGK